MGRKKKNKSERLGEPVGLTVTPAQLKQIKTAAKAEGRTIAAFCRLAALERAAAGAE